MNRTRQIKPTNEKMGKTSKPRTLCYKDKDWRWGFLNLHLAMYATYELLQEARKRAGLAMVRLVITNAKNYSPVRGIMVHADHAGITSVDALLPFEWFGSINKTRRVLDTIGIKTTYQRGYRRFTTKDSIHEILTRFERFVKEEELRFPHIAEEYFAKDPEQRHTALEQLVRRNADWKLIEPNPKSLSFKTTTIAVEEMAPPKRQAPQPPMNMEPHTTTPAGIMQQNMNNVDVARRGITQQPHLDSVTAMQAPMLTNTAISNTIDLTPGMQMRTDYLPPQFLSYGGVMEDLKDLALGSYSYVKTIHVPVGTPAGTVVDKIVYGLDAFGSFNKQWLMLHKRYTGPIQLRFRPISNTVIQGDMRISWIPDSSMTVNLQNASGYGAQDFNMAQPNQCIEIMLQPVAGPNGLFYFTTDTPPVGQPAIVLMMLTDLGNSFSNLGYVDIVVESRMLPDFFVAEPILSDGNTPTPGGSEDLIAMAKSLGIDVAKTTVAVDAKAYPKFKRPFSEVKEPAFLGKTFYDMPNKPGEDSDNTHTMAGWVYPDNAEEIAVGSARRFLLPPKNTTDRRHILGGQIVPQHIPLTEQAIRPWLEAMADDEGEFDNADGHFEYAIDFYGRRFTGIVYKMQDTTSTDFYRTSGVVQFEVPKLYNGQFVEEVITDGSLDSAQLPSTYVTLDFISTDHPTVSDVLATSNKNLLITSDFTAFLYNWCITTCPADGQIIFTIFDPQFTNQPFIQFVYRPKIGFITSADASQKYSYFLGNLSTYKMTYVVQGSQSQPTLTTDYTNFATILSTVAPQVAREEMNVALMGVSGLFGGLGQAAAQNRKFKQEITMQNLQNQGAYNTATINALGNFDAGARASMINQQGAMARQVQQQQYNTGLNNYMHSPSGTSNGHIAQAYDNQPTVLNDNVRQMINDGVRGQIRSSPTLSDAEGLEEETEV